MQENLNVVFVLSVILSLSVIIYWTYAISTILARLNDIHDEMFEIRKSIHLLDELKEKK
jgi:hypothetical protein